MISAKSDQTGQSPNSLIQINNPGNSPDNLKITFKMIAALVILMSAHLVLPRLTDLTVNLQIRKEYTRQMLEVSHEEVITPEEQNPLSDKYEPPNFGAPDSNRGSGTR